MKQSDIIVIFFCISLVMLFFGALFFVTSFKYRIKGKSNTEIEYDKIEVEAILNDAKDLLREIDGYSTEVIDKMDSKIEEMQKLVKEFEQIKVTHGSDEANSQFSIASSPKAMDEPHENTEKIQMEIANPLHKQIVKLFNDGLNVEDISKKLGLGKNEVKLIINRYNVKG